jgi:hypothetical protein
LRRHYLVALTDLLTTGRLCLSVAGEFKEAFLEVSRLMSRKNGYIS